MAITNAGLDQIASLITGAGTDFSSTNARIGVGNGGAAVAVSQTDLQGSSKVRKGMDSGYPKVSGPTVTFRSTFLPAEANFAWLEWGIFNAASGGTMLNRVAENNSTKLSNQTWIMQVDVTFVTA